MEAKKAAEELEKFLNTNTHTPRIKAQHELEEKCESHPTEKSIAIDTETMQFLCSKCVFNGDCQNPQFLA